MAITKVTNRVLDDSSVGVAQLSSLAVPTKLTSEIGALNFRNKIINGNFDIWQRGTSLTSGTGGSYLADRWSNYSVGSTYTVSREAFTQGQTSVPGEPQYFHRTVVTSVAGANNYASLAQNIEDVRTFAGKTVSVSFWAKTTAGTKQICATVSQDFGTGGSPSVRVQNPHSSNFTLTTTWQKFTFSIAVPSISGKTLGSNNNSYLILGWWFDAGSNWNSATNSLVQQSGTFDIAQVQLEEGPVATPFEQRPIGLELSLCQRYYEKSYPIDVAPGATNEYRGAEYEIQAVYTTNPFSGGALLRPSFKQTKRTSAPTITVYNPNNGTANQLSIWSNGSTFDRNVGISTPVINHKNALIWPVTGTTVNSGYICIAHWAVDAEL